MSYPKWIYHRTEAPKVVNSIEEHTALGKGWEESPAAFRATEPEGADEVNYSQLSAKELQAMAMEKGILDDANGVLSKKELIRLLTGEKQ